MSLTVAPAWKLSSQSQQGKTHTEFVQVLFIILGRNLQKKNHSKIFLSLVLHTSLHRPYVFTTQKPANQRLKSWKKSLALPKVATKIP